MGNFPQIEADLRLNERPSATAMSEGEARAFLAGAFLSGGSVSAPSGGNYHMELQAPDRAYLAVIAEMLERENVVWKTRVIERRGRFVLYFKRAEAIADALRFMNVSETLFAFEDQRIRRDLDNNLRRINNLDVSNIRRTAKTAANATPDAAALLVSPGFSRLPEKLRAYCRARTENPEASLGAIAEIVSADLGEKVSRGTVWRLSRQARDAAAKLPKERGDSAE